MAHIVVIGAGLGGMPAAYDLQKHFGKAHQVTLIGNSPQFQFTPSNPWVAVGWRTPEQVMQPIRPYVEKKGIRFVEGWVDELDAVGNTLKLRGGETLHYDFLVIATGPQLAFDEIPGLGPDTGFTQSVCSTPHAAKAYQAWQRFVENPGPIVVGAVQGASCFGPAYETALIIDADLRKRKIRHKVPITYVSSEPYVGHMGLGGVGDSKGMLEGELRQRHIKWVVNAKTTRIEAGKMFVTEMDSAGAPLKEHELPFAYSMMLPAFRGVEFIRKVEGLANPRGFVLIDEFQRNPRYTNIFSVGVCVAIPPVEVTPVPTGAPKTGYMIESMVTATVRNIEAVMAGAQPSARATWNAICLADMGDTGMAFVALPQIPPRNVTWTRSGAWVHLAKVGFEKYFMRKMKTGNPEPYYERMALRMMGIERLEE